MAPGIAGAEGSPHAHEVLKAEIAIKYLEKRGGYEAAIEMLKAAKPDKSPLTYRGSSGVGKNRDDFGKIINEILDGMDREQRIASVRVFDNDLEGSCGLHHIRKKHPEVFVRGGIMERGNFSAAAGFGSAQGKQGIYATFSAFPRNVHQRNHHGAPELLQRAGALQPQRRGRHGGQHLPLRHQQHVRRRRASSRATARTRRACTSPPISTSSPPA